MTIVLDARTATTHFPGIGRYVVNLARAMARVEPDMNVSLLCDPASGAANTAFPDFPRIPCSVSPFSISQQWIVPRELHHSRARLYHSPFYLMPYHPGRPVVLTCYDMIPLVYPAYFSAKQRLIYRAAHALALKTSKFVLAISHATKTDLIRYFRVSPERIVVTLLAADEHFVPQPSERIEAVRRKYSLPEHYVLYFGSNKPHKNLVRLVDAWGLLKNGPKVTDHALVIAGHWDDRYPQAKMQVRCLHLDRDVMFLPDIPEDDLPALYSGASLFVFPSEYEGFGLPVLEAMACGVPVVCSNCSSLPEVAGNAALLVNPQGVEELAAAMSRVINQEDLSQDLRKRGLTRARNFSWEQTARETAAVYRAALEMSKP
jgi:alpha-1,3-rhamnosyl/mannosyltransferase